MAADDTPAIVAQGLTKQFGKLVAVDHLDIRVRRTEIYDLDVEVPPWAA